MFNYVYNINVITCRKVGLILLQRRNCPIYFGFDQYNGRD